MRRRHPLLLGSALALLGAAPAAAAEVQVQGIGTSWSTPDVRIAAGDSVVWSFPNPEEVHNVQADVRPGTTSWTFYQPAQKPAPTVSRQFDTAGVYGFICFVHGAAMSGTVTVGDAPPPPPPPLSEQPFPNDSSITTSLFETGGIDTTKPTLRGVTAKRSGKRVKVSFKVSEQSVVTVRLSRGGKTVKTKTASTSSSGSVTVGGLKTGRYRVEIRAEDVAGNRSGVRVARVTLR